jgi:hypothetical protein
LITPFGRKATTIATHGAVKGAGITAPSNILLNQLLPVSDFFVS